MKKLFTLLAFVILGLQSQAQRYDTKIFAQVSMDSVVYGNANDWSNVAQELKMNIFQPVGDTIAQRPLLVLAHGGSFIGGSRYAEDVTYLCTEFAKRGYVCVSIQYRLGIDFQKFFTEGGTQFANAVWRGTLDGRAAIRYLRANANLYKINTSQIYIGGVSAGGVLGLHEAFLDVSSEVASADPAIDTLSIGGGIEGLSGTPNQSWRVKGVISLCGALGSVSWMSNNTDVSIFSVHGTNDQTVPYKTDYFKAFGYNVAKLSGGFVVDSMARALGMKSYLYTFINAPHVPFSPGVGTLQSSTAYMDTTETLLKDYLLGDLNRNVGLSTVFALEDIKLYPNPASGFLSIDIYKGHLSSISITDIHGKLIRSIETNLRTLKLDVENWNAGIYFMTITNDYGQANRKFLVN